MKTLKSSREGKSVVERFYRLNHVCCKRGLVMIVIEWATECDKTGDWQQQWVARIASWRTGEVLRQLRPLQWSPSPHSVSV